MTGQMHVDCGTPFKFAVQLRLSALAGRKLHQAPLGPCVEAQIAVLTSGNMAMSLQVQLIATILRPEELLSSLQQNGLNVSNIILQSLDVEQVDVVKGT